MRRLVVPLLTAFAVTLGPIEPAPVIAAPSPAPVLVAGDVPDGTDITGVSVMLDPTDDVLASLEVGETAPPIYTPAAAVTVFSDTHFEVRLDPTTIPRTYLTSDGLVFAMVTVTRDSAESLTTTTSARAVADPTTGEVAWRDALESANAIRYGDRTRVGGRAFPTAVDDGDVHQDEAEDDGVTVESGEYDPVFRGYDITDTPAGCSDTKLAERTRSVTIGTTYPVGGDSASMEVNSSTGASYGTAWSFKNPSGVWGEFSASNGKFTRSGWGFEWAPSSASRSYRKGVVYGKFLRDCARGCDECLSFWRPLSETGGTGSNTGISRPNWGNCKHIDPGKWYRDDANGNNYNYGAAVKFAEVIGIDLSISREYNTSQKIWYKASTDRRMCGNDDWPATAGKVMMRYYN